MISLKPSITWFSSSYFPFIYFLRFLNCIDRNGIISLLLLYIFISIESSSGSSIGAIKIYGEYCISPFREFGIALLVYNGCANNSDLK